MNITRPTMALPTYRVAIEGWHNLEANEGRNIQAIAPEDAAHDAVQAQEYENSEFLSLERPLKVTVTAPNGKTFHYTVRAESSINYYVKAIKHE